MGDLTFPIYEALVQTVSKYDCFTLSHMAEVIK